uniref:Secretory carrier-associated membrane protein n=1 Tax=Rhodnius prolixus TaxID=13249 RepID=T1HKZ8_RHOPR
MLLKLKVDKLPRGLCRALDVKLRSVGPYCLCQAVSWREFWSRNAMNGVIIALKCFDSSVSGIITGLIILSIACGYCIAAVLDLLLITKIHRIYRSTGASMAKAQAEFTTEFLKNEHVRDAASTAATAAVQAQFQAARTPPSRY